MSTLEEARERFTLDRDRAALAVAAAKVELAKLGLQKPFPELPSLFVQAAIIGLPLATPP